MATCRLEHSSGWGTRTVLIDGRPLEWSDAERKSAAEAGTATVIVATLGVVDRDGDVIERGALLNTTAVVSRKEHAVMHGEDPVGRAVLEERGSQLLAHIVFDDGPSCRLMLDERPDISMGYRAEQTREPTPAERAKGARRIITRLRVLEVSAVTKAAGIGTGVLGASCKCAGACGCGQPSWPDPADVKALLERANLVLIAAAHAERQHDFETRDCTWLVPENTQREAKHLVRFGCKRLGLYIVPHVAWRDLPDAWGLWTPSAPLQIALHHELPADRLPETVGHELYHYAASIYGWPQSEDEATRVGRELASAWEAMGG